MVRIFPVLLLWWAMVVSLPAWAQSLTLSADSVDLVVGQTIGVSVVARGGRISGVPELRTSPGLEVAFVDQSSSMSIINGRADSFVKFRYAVVAAKTGSWQLGPAILAMPNPSGSGGRTIQSDVLELRVVPAPAGGLPTAPITVETSFDRAQAWQGQVVVYHQAFRSRLELAHAGWLKEPDQGLLAMSKDRPDLREYVMQDERGALLVQESRRPFLVMEAGKLSWDAPVLQADIVVSGGGGLLGMFQRTRREPVVGQSMSLDVLPLPPAPPGASSLVGDFTLDVRLDRERAAVGQTVTWRIAIIGNGSVDGFQLPLPGEVDGARVYEGVRGQAGAVVQGAYQANVVFEREVVPTREGKVELPPIEVIAFSPSRGAWVSLQAPGRTLTVRAGEALDPELTSFAQKELPDLADTVQTGPRDLWRSGPGYRLPWLEALPGAMALVAAPGLWAVLSALLTWVRRIRAERQQRSVREPTPLERIAELPSDGAARLRVLDEALRAGLAAGTLPPDWEPEVRSLQDALDRARFAGAQAPADVVSRVRAVLEVLEAR